MANKQTIPASRAQARRARKQRLARRNRRLCLGLSASLLALAILLLPLLRELLPHLSAIFLAIASAIGFLTALILLLRRRITAIPAAMLVLMLAALIASPFAHRYAMTGLGLLRTDTTQLDLSGASDSDLSGIQCLTQLESIDLRASSVANFEPLYALPRLTRLDARENYAFTPEIRAQLLERSPACEVIWSIPLFGSYYDSSLPIDLTALTLSVEELESLQRQYPELSIAYAVSIQGTRAICTDTHLDLTNARVSDMDALIHSLRLLPNLQTVDLRGSLLEIDEIDALTDALPEVEFLCAFRMLNQEVDSASTSLTLPQISEEDIAELERCLPYLAHMADIDLRGSDVRLDEIDRLLAAYPGITFHYNFAMMGVETSTEATEVILSGKQISDVATVEKYLKHLPNVRRIEMCDCGVPDEEMAALNDRHSDIRFIWTVYFGHYSLRTDATAFSTLLTGRNTYGYNSRTFQPLKYCTDLEALDLGHNHISNISFLSRLTKLKILILACNRITDISPLAEMPDLEYVELFTNSITDFSPLSGKEKLVDLNICRNSVKSVKPLLNCPALERLWVGKCGLSNNDLSSLKKALPDCTINTTAGDAPTTEGWRKHARYDVMKEIFKTGVYRPFA